jgi:hypothetical protein
MVHNLAPLLNPYRHRMESAEPSTVRTKRKISHDSPLKISSDSATSVSQDRHRLGVKGGGGEIILRCRLSSKATGKWLARNSPRASLRKKRRGGEISKTQKEMMGIRPAGTHVATRGTCRMEQVKLFSYSVCQRAEFNWCHHRKREGDKKREGWQKKMLWSISSDGCAKR